MVIVRSRPRARYTPGAISRGCCILIGWPAFLTPYAQLEPLDPRVSRFARRPARTQGLRDPRHCSESRCAAESTTSLHLLSGVAIRPKVKWRRPAGPRPVEMGTQVGNQSRWDQRPWPPGYRSAIVDVERQTMRTHTRCRGPRHRDGPRGRRCDADHGRGLRGPARAGGSRARDRRATAGTGPTRRLVGPVCHQPARPPRANRWRPSPASRTTFDPRPAYRTPFRERRVAGLWPTRRPGETVCGNPVPRRGAR